MECAFIFRLSNEAFSLPVLSASSCCLSYNNVHYRNQCSVIILFVAWALAEAASSLLVDPFYQLYQCSRSISHRPLPEARMEKAVIYLFRPAHSTAVSSSVWIPPSVSHKLVFESDEFIKQAFKMIICRYGIANRPFQDPREWMSQQHGESERERDVQLFTMKLKSVWTGYSNSMQSPLRHL